jgi:dCTP deaminase
MDWCDECGGWGEYYLGSKELAECSKCRGTGKMILSAQTIRQHGSALISPFFEEQKVSESGLTYGLGPCGYDIRIDKGITLGPNEFALASSIEYFRIPDYLAMKILDKSTWARRGIMVQNTIAEPGWHGYLTLEITNHSINNVTIQSGDPIAQVVFEQLDQPTDTPYTGKYQNQKKGPQPAIMSTYRISVKG